MIKLILAIILYCILVALILTCMCVLFKIHRLVNGVIKAFKKFLEMEI